MKPHGRARPIHRSVGAAALMSLMALSLGAGTPLLGAGQTEAPGKAAFREFNDTLFTVAYDVFLAARNVKEAFHLAREAVRQRPNLPAWRERLAKTAEWAGDPQLALREWEHLGAGSRRTDAYREAIRLSGALRDYVAAVRAWEGLAGLRELDVAEWGQLVEAYENSGEPAKGVARLWKRLAARPDRTLAAQLVDVLLRSGRDGEALEVLDAMASRYGNTAAIGLHRAEIHCRRGHIREAALALDAVRDLPATEAERGALLRLQAVVYIWMQRYGDALAAYRTLFEGGRYEAADMRDLYSLARERDRDLALRAAVAGWSRFREPEFLIYYLERCLEVERWDLASGALARLIPEQWEIFAETPYFFVLSARIHQREGKAALARRGYRHALAREPASEEFRAGYLWLLIEQGRMSELAVHADRWGRGPATPPALLEPLAMAYKLLQRHRLALAYFRLLDEGEKREDLPFLVGYAELLAEAGDGRGAASAYARAREALRSPSIPGHGEERTGRDWQVAEARLSWKFGSSDATARRIAALTSAYRGGAGTQDLAFSWRVDRGQNPEDAMAVLGGSGVGEKAFPAWARLAVAMRAEDVGKVADLLENRESGLGAEDKARAAAFLGLRKQAAGYAGEIGPGRATPPTASGLPARRGAAGLGGSFQVAGHPHYEEHRTGMEGQAPLGAGTLLLAAAETRRRPWISNRLTMAVPSREDAGRLAIRRMTRHGTTSLSAGFRSTAEALQGGDPDPTLFLSAEQEWRVRALTFSAGLESNAIAEENPILALVGRKDRWKAALRLSLPDDTEADLSLAGARFETWDGRRLGQGSLMRATAERRLLRPLSAGLSLAYNGFAPAGSRPGPQGNPLVAGLLAPREFPRTFWHGSAFLELQERAQPGRAWLPAPFASVEAGRNIFPATETEAAVGANEFAVRLGLAMKPTAAQRLAVLAGYARGLHRLDEAETGLSLQYAYSFR